MTKPNQLSERLLMASRKGQDCSRIIGQLESLSALDLPDDASRKAFWINCYNAFMLLTLLQQPSLWRKDALYTKKLINIAGNPYSFDDIEHGILRRQQFKYGLGYIGHPFWPKHIKEGAVQELDCRIHFALNCGAKSCPPIAHYTAQNIDNELETATSSFLQATSTYVERQNRIRVSRLFLWFNGDFGGKDGIRTLLSLHGILPENASPSIAYDRYDWTLALPIPQELPAP